MKLKNRSDKTPGMTRTCAGLLVAAAVSGWAGTASAAEYWLRADVVNKTMADGRVVPMWGFALDTDGNFATSEGPATVPGPVLTVAPGDTTLTVHVYNNLPQLNGADTPVSLVIHGQRGGDFTPVASGDGRVRSFTHETGRLATGNYTWTNVRPGTFLYQSGTNPALHVQMGLYGAMKKDASTGNAYAGVPYKYENVLVYSEVDPDFHDAVAADNFGPGKLISSAMRYKSQYYLINGASYPNIPPLVVGQGIASEMALVRVLNAGLESRVPVFQNLHVTQVAEDGNPSPHLTTRHSALLAAGKTVDVTFPSPTTGERFAVYDRRLGLSNGSASGGGAIVVASVGGAPAGGAIVYMGKDEDKDGVPDFQDNCTKRKNATQIDTNGDGYGNACDGDLVAPFGVTNVADWNRVKGAIGKTVGQPGFTLEADFDGNGVVNVVDANYFKGVLYNKAPGPSCCAP